MVSIQKKMTQKRYRVDIIEFGTPEFDEEIALRDKVLRKPLGLEYTAAQIADEWDSIHLGVYHSGGQLLGCLVLKPLPDGEWKMRQVAVDPEWQGKGLGGMLVEFSEKYLIRKGAFKMVLHARDTAVEFYRSLGYSIVGDPFTEVGIPHRAMEKEFKYEKD